MHIQKIRCDVTITHVNVIVLIFILLWSAISISNWNKCNNLDLWLISSVSISLFVGLSAWIQEMEASMASITNSMTKTIGLNITAIFPGTIIHTMPGSIFFENYKSTKLENQYFHTPESIDLCTLSKWNEKWIHRRQCVAD